MRFLQALLPGTIAKELLEEYAEYLKVICVSRKKTSVFRKQFDPKDIDTYFTEKTTLGEIKDGIRRLMFPEKYQEQRTETAEGVGGINRLAGGNGAYGRKSLI